VLSAQGYPELLIWHDIFMLCPPVRIYAIPSISLKNMAANGTLTLLFIWYSFFATQAFWVFFHIFFPPILIS
jgi:hypothetical protein